MQEVAIDPATVGSEIVASFLALRGLASVEFSEPNAAVLCNNERFHWNGSELVICSIGLASWSGLVAVPVEVTLVAGSIQVAWTGIAATDRVIGVAPEYREQLVTYLGPGPGHAAADAVGAHTETHRLFITPEWRSEDVGR